MSNKKFLIAFDMDGTLLEDKQKTIMPKTKEYLKHLSEQGHFIVLASGRPESELTPYYEELGLNSPMICFSGIYCFNPKDSNFPKIERTFPKQWAIDLSKDFLKNKVAENVFIENNEEIWMDHDNPKLIQLMWQHGIKRSMTFGSIEKTLNKDPMTIIFFDANGCNVKYIQDKLSAYPKSHVRFWFDNRFADISFGNPSKALALQHICNHYGIDENHTICFGDYLNDVEMVKWAKYGVAMKNACDELKKVANIITDEDNNHEGIYTTLKNIIEND